MTPASPIATPPRTEVRGSVWIAAIILFTTLLPPEVRVTVAGIELFSYRLAFLLLLPFIVRHAPANVRKPVPSDLIVLFSAVWMVAAMVANQGLAAGIQRSLSVAMDLLLGYIVARASIASINDLRRLLVIMAPFFLLAGLLVMAESLTHGLIVQPVVQKIFPNIEAMGIVMTSLANYQTRMGLFRGVGAFPHPILGGLYLASVVPLFFTSHLRGWPGKVGLLAGCLAFFSVSSTAFMMLALSIGLLFYDWLTRMLQGIRWQGLLLMVGLSLTAYQLFSSHGLIGLTVKLAMDGNTAYYRSLTWQFAGAAVAAHPVFGLGDGHFARPVWMVSDTIDNYWLLLAVRYGYAVPAAQLLATISIMFQLGQGSRLVDRTDSYFLRGLCMTISVVTLGGFFVALFSGVQIWFAVLLGCGANCALFARGQHKLRQSRVVAEQRARNIEQHTRSAAA
ncbi:MULTISPECIES: hypothetical protein [unclassified Novosphingobium]|uniref:hypothetical protein n=1 Tax=unclassified Novosphingobium TaxID=2644732 RepID=UPI00086DBA37|nr:MULTISPECIES: hypothetical protein [unclassified Novosphingobium]MBN9145387.1 hypothetical protein [Novosphingobium sp.]MDR6709872.1 O-antigen ligase [Novosphingobium sp. 1748]ODU83149.1 MAG: hypothetical protein ABT10_08145 [Novosphingobium sp. SCN 63-17]OJX88109.1 MAG: hypothetical protein BGP00_01995 [Novosphingobium sp. 63-713]